MYKKAVQKKVHRLRKIKIGRSSLSLRLRGQAVFWHYTVCDTDKRAVKKYMRIRQEKHVFAEKIITLRMYLADENGGCNERYIRWIK